MSKIICCNVNYCPLSYATCFVSRAISTTRPISIARFKIGESTQALWLHAKRCEKVLAA